MKIKLEMTQEELTKLHLCKNLLEAYAPEGEFSLVDETVADVRAILDRVDFIHDN